MSQDTKPKANWTVINAHMQVSDKGSIKLVNERGQQIGMIFPQGVELLAATSAQFVEYANSSQYRAIGEAKQAAKLDKTLAREQEKALEKAATAIEMLQKLGIDVSKLTKAG